MKKRTLIEENESLLPVLSRDLKSYKPLLEKVRVTFEKLDLESFTDANLKEVVITGTRNIEVEFESKMKAQLKKAGVTSTVIQENMMNGSRGIFQAFKDAVGSLKNYIPKRMWNEINYILPLDKITYENELFFISGEDQENILEDKGRIYLDTESEHRLYEKLNQFIKSFEALRADLEVANFPIKEIGSIAHHFLTLKNEKYSVTPNMIKGALERHEKRKEFEQKRMERYEKRLELTTNN
jgi:hypothetical protein